MKWKCPRSVGKGIDAAHEWTENGTCSYCHSISPEMFMERIKDGAHMLVTNSDYKVYVGDKEDKFYFNHLNQAQREEFVRMFNDKQLRFHAPGHFVVFPYFFAFDKSPV